MTVYVVGDVQGCFDSLKQLLDVVNFDEKTDELWSTGDLVNRGKQSLDVLRFFKSLGKKQRIVLGNHDLHLLAVALGVREPHRNDTLQAILTAPDRDELLDWLRHQPLLIHDETYECIITHAGLAPMWTVDEAKHYAKEVETVLRGSAPLEFFKEMYGNVPVCWDNTLTGMARLRCIVNYLTRMRFCYADGGLNLEYKGDIAHKPEDVVPWFMLPNRANKESHIIFGHWAALNGVTGVPMLDALDTGCVWGNSLTMMRLSDGKRFSVACSLG